MTSARILNIHTCTETAIVNFAVNGKVVAQLQNENAKEHGEFLHVAIKQLLEETNIKAATLSAVAVTTGPGSYTGIRVGFAAAKGLCFALSLPLITLNTLEFLAFCGIKRIRKEGLFVPMIDARRMEVYTAVYNENMEQLLTPQAMILEADSFDSFSEQPIWFFGSGSAKYEASLANQSSAFSFVPVEFEGDSFADLTRKKYDNSNFANVAYSEPQYLKEFFTFTKK